MMEATPPSTKKRKTVPAPTTSQPLVTNFFKPTRQDEPRSTGNTEEDVSDDNARVRPDSPELFSSPSPVGMATASSLSVHSSSRGTSSTRSLTSSLSDKAPLWSGSPLNELCFGPCSYPILPPLVPSPHHSILFRPRLTPGSLPQPCPDRFRDVWDQHHVRMPCSSKSEYPLDDGRLVSRWDLIKQALSRTIANVHDFEEALLSYNSHYARRWGFKGLYVYFDEICSEEERDMFFKQLLPRIVSLALSLPDIVTHAVPLLKKQQDYSITLSQQQIACLLANAFLCTFPRRNTIQRSSEYASYPFINFNTLFTANARKSISQDRENKLRCLFHYFTRVTAKMPLGVVTFERQVLKDPPHWENSSTLLTKLHVISEGSIEDKGHGMLQASVCIRHYCLGTRNLCCRLN